MAPELKKRKTDATPSKFRCFICMTYRGPSQFPDYNPTPECEHLINICLTCLRKWVRVNVEGTTFLTGVSNDGEKIWGIKCPQCDKIMRNVNVQMAAAKTVHERFEDFERKHIGDTIPGWRWCFAPGCKAGQVHKSNAESEQATAASTRPRRRAVAKRTAKSPSKSGLAEEVDICVCNTCGAKACVRCDRPWHEGESCVEYQARITGRIDDENLTMRTIKLKTKKCPTCQTNIQKNGGCSFMRCTQCNTPFCWTCELVLNGSACRCNRVAV